MENRQIALEARSNEVDPTEARILGAAAALISTRGIDGLTVTEVAKRAGVSRPTVYRRWAGTDELVRATLLRATLALIERIDAERVDAELPAAEQASRRALVDTVLRFTELFRADPLYRGLLEHEPEVFTRYSLLRIGSGQRALLLWLGAAIARAQEYGEVRVGAPADIAIMLLLIAQSAILSHRSVSALIDAEALDVQLRAAVDGYLRP